jgi:ADP-ribose pyrophosphatase
MNTSEDLPPVPAVVAQQTLIPGGKYSYQRLSLKGPTGRTWTRDMVVHPGAVLVVPVLDDGRIVMIRNYRVAVQQWVLELCAGTLDHTGESIASCAGRELEEETGYIAASLTQRGWFYTTPGLTDEKMFVVEARGLTKAQQKLEPDETIQVLIMSRAELADAVANGELLDGKSIAGLVKVFGSINDR